MEFSSGLSIFEGKYQEPYAASGGRVFSTALGKRLRWAKIMVDTDGEYTWRDGAGNSVTFDLKSGVPYPFFVTLVTAQAGNVVIIHDGVLDSGVE